MFLPRLVESIVHHCPSPGRLWRKHNPRK